MKGLNCTTQLPASARHLRMMRLRPRLPMPKLKSSSNQRLIEFPVLDPAVGLNSGLQPAGLAADPAAATSAASAVTRGRPGCEVVLSGTYRKDFQSLRYTYEQF